MDAIAQDVRFALRGLARRPGFTGVALLTLVVGIGANVAMFSVLHRVALRPLPFDSPGELVRVDWSARTFNQRIYAFYRDTASSFASLAAYSGWAFTLTGDGPPLEVHGAQVTPSYFDVLGVPPALGRGFEPEEALGGRSDVAVVSHGLWMSRFGGEESILGRRIDLAGAGRNGVTVIGVMPPDHASVEAGGTWDVWVPLETASDLEKDDSWFLSVVGRLRPGVDVQEAQEESKALARRVAEQMYPRTSEPELSAGAVTRLSEVVVGRTTRARLWTLLGAVAIVLLVACANVANLLLARAGGRSREIAVRAALGAGRRRVLRLLVTESLVLAGLGGILGVLVAHGIVAAFAAMLAGVLPRAAGLRVDGTVLGFALALSLVTGLVFGLAPALRATAYGAAERLRSGGVGAGATRKRARGHRLLVMGEVAISVALVASAGLVLESFFRLTSVDVGFQPDRTLVVGVYAPESIYREEEQKRRFHRELATKLSAIPGVEAAGSIHLLPMGPGNWNFPYYPEGRVLGEDDSPPVANFRVVAPGYFRSMGIPVLSGRSFTGVDRGDSVRVGIVNAAFARREWPGGDPLGKEIRIFSSAGPSFTVVGVVGDVRQHGLADEGLPEMYRPLEQWPLARTFVTLRAAPGIAPSSLVTGAREAVWSLDAAVPIFRMSPMRDVVADSVASDRLLASLLGGFAGVALFLAGIGVYGVSSYVAAASTREIGLRMALGARRGRVLASELARGMLPALAGTALGLLGALALGRVISSFLFDAASSPRPVIFGIVLLGVLSISLVACFAPARRASRVDPMAALRFE